MGAHGVDFLEHRCRTGRDVHGAVRTHLEQRRRLHDAVALFDDRCTQPDDNPTIGIILCATKDATVARYSALADNKGLFASRYTLCLPTEEELARALEPTSALFLEQDAGEGMNGPASAPDDFASTV